ncbi:MAG: ATP-binding cassette domain-containing protein [Acidobacteriota bacterium]|nr:ATP-binding cassette domain-containing protein [Blastocatellia bacterium]MDW8412589.1 ATP-binding cassette domain-containing protein [Acidobacteriota bacterium]
MNPAIEFKDVYLSFGEQKILDGVSFRVKQGKTLILMGGSGTGKSTTLKLVLGLLKPDGGRIFVDGQDITDLSERELIEVRQKIGMVFQEGALFDSLNVFENVGFKLFEKGVKEKDVERVVRQMLRFVDLEEAIYKMPSELSGGMRRRVGIARALVGHPKIILFDEPTAGLDPPTSCTIVELAMKLRDIEGVSSIFVTHQLRDARKLASEKIIVDEAGKLQVVKNEQGMNGDSTEFVMLKEGKIIFEGSGNELWASQDPYIREFIS